MSQTEKLREQILCQNPTEEQKNAIFTEELEYLLRASPGSGKTWTSCRRFIWRGANWDHQVGGLALLSFTNAAIREFHEATIRVGRRDLLSDPNYVGTFDSFVERFIITPFGHLIIGSSKRPKLFIAPRPGDWANTKLQAWSESRGGRKLKVPAWEIIPFPNDGKVAFKASRKFGGQTLEFKWHNPVQEFFRLGFYTHAQRVYLACRILFDRPHIADCISRRFPEILVDEAQDTNIWLLILLNFLRDKGTKVTLVGDPDQCIYEFSMADSTSLPALKEKWGIPEKPLSQSFRCNCKIAESVRNISGNTLFVGCETNGNEYHRSFVVREQKADFSQSVSEFEHLLVRAGIPQTKSAILCRAHHQLESIRGKVNYTAFKGLTKEMAQAAFYRDTSRDYKKAHKIVENSVREMTDEPGFWEALDDSPESEESHRVRLALWQFTKSPNGLPSVRKNGSVWIDSLRKNLTQLLATIGISQIPKMGQKIRRTGLDTNQMALPLFEPQTIFPPIRQETIHQVKGESIDGVLVLGSAKFFNTVVKAVESNENTEERRVAYVAMTRARHALLIGLPASHFDIHITAWKRWGFHVI
ncbi:MAG: ATP-dependent helicase [Deltaproteobacteria bacterium]|nr:ATP-dependent helicase [Deltaproteobacteria bacterium]